MVRHVVNISYTLQQQNNACYLNQARNSLQLHYVSVYLFMYYSVI